MDKCFNKNYLCLEILEKSACDTVPLSFLVWKKRWVQIGSLQLICTVIWNFLSFYRCKSQILTLVKVGLIFTYFRFSKTGTMLAIRFQQNWRIAKSAKIGENRQNGLSPGQRKTIFVDLFFVFSFTHLKKSSPTGAGLNNVCKLCFSLF